jgi:hypothetical protein
VTTSATTKWTKSSFCADSTCIEVAFVDADVVAMRDSKNVDQPSLRFTRGQWNSFLDAVTAGEYRFR